MFFYLFFFFFFNDTATTEIYTLSLHDALPISDRRTQCLRARWTLLRHHPPPERHPRIRRSDRGRHGRDRCPAPLPRVLAARRPVELPPDPGGGPAQSGHQ